MGNPSANTNAAVVLWRGAVRCGAAHAEPLILHKGSHRSVFPLPAPQRRTPPRAMHTAYKGEGGWLGAKGPHSARTSTRGGHGGARRAKKRLTDGSHGMVSQKDLENSRSCKRVLQKSRKWFSLKGLAKGLTNRSRNWKPGRCPAHHGIKAVNRAS